MTDAQQPERCKKGDYLHHNASPSHTEGAWCNDCGDFVPLGQFDGSQFHDTGTDPYMTDLRGVAAALVNHQKIKNALRRIAYEVGPGDSLIRKLAVGALAPKADPTIPLYYIDHEVAVELHGQDDDDDGGVADATE